MKLSIDGDITLFCGDMRAIIDTCGPVDCIVTDPPYELVSGGNTSGEMRGCFDKENYNNSGKIVECDLDWCDFMPLLSAVLPKGDAYIMANNRNVKDMLVEAEKAKFAFHNILVWDKITATPNRWYMKNCEFIGYFFKGNAEAINDCATKQLIRCKQIDVSDHPTEKPVALMEMLIRNSTKPGDIVLDPFMGSGSTGVAAKRLGRKFMGIEIDPNHFDTAVKRIGGAQRVHTLF